MRRPGYPSTKPHEQGERTVNRGGAWAMPRAEFELVPRPSPVGPAVASRRAHPPADSASAVRAARGNNEHMAAVPAEPLRETRGLVFPRPADLRLLRLRVSGVCVALCAACPVRGGAYTVRPRRSVASCEGVVRTPVRSREASRCQWASSAMKHLPSHSSSSFSMPNAKVPAFD